MNRVSWFAFIDKIPPFLLAGVWAIFILIISTIGVGMNLPSSWWEIISWDKLAHAIVYFVLAYFLYKGFRLKQTKSRAIWYAISLATFYGILMEFVQYAFFPNRYFEVLDIIANIVGIIVCAFLVQQKK